MFRTTAIGVASIVFATAAVAQPFGGQEDQDYAAQIWEAMVAANVAGPDAPMVMPYAGSEPHGFQLTTLFTTVTIGGHEGALVIKNNYGPEGVEVDEVLADPAGHLGAVTVMFKREAGYDAETQDWFYAKYLPDGTLDQNPKGMALAGLVGKGGDAGCIACHQNAGGDDYLFVTDADVSKMLMDR